MKPALVETEIVPTPAVPSPRIEIVAVPLVTDLTIDFPYVASSKLIVPAPVIVAVTESSATPGPPAALLIVTRISASVVESAVETAEIATSATGADPAAPMNALV